MSQENVEVVREALAAFEQDREAYLARLDSGIEWTPFEEGTTTRGLEAVGELRDRWIETWESHRIEIEETWHREEHVVVAVHVTGRGRISGLEVDARLWVHFKVRDGKVFYIYEHEDRSEALEAAGLSE